MGNILLQDFKKFEKLDLPLYQGVSNDILYEFSIIIPVFQEEKLLPKVLKLFRTELLSKYKAELIISDGGSSDRTVEIAKKYTEKVVVHTSKRKQTIAEGRNRGAEIATGKVLIFLNGDTLPNNVEKFFEYISSWYYTDTKHIALAFKVRAFPDEETWKDKLFYFLHNNYVRFLNMIGLGMGRGECQVIRRDAFWKVGGYNSNISAGEDFDLYRRLAKIGKIKFVSDIWVYESPRRFRKYGYFRTILKWLLNGIFVWLFGRSFSNHWEPVR
ncbi:MAG: glycosyltransferase [Ignavibacteria bacterium]|nr:glycosyltransferase [Ignavibacteria bacterium]